MSSTDDFECNFDLNDKMIIGNMLIDDGRSVTCCTEDGTRVLPSDLLHYACLPIEIEPEDDFYGSFGQGCINFVRSALSPDGECRLGYGKQVRMFEEHSLFGP